VEAGGTEVLVVFSGDGHVGPFRRRARVQTVLGGRRLRTHRAEVRIVDLPSGLSSGITPTAAKP
jgi:hypothetical protein